MEILEDSGEPREPYTECDVPILYNGTPLSPLKISLPMEGSGPHLIDIIYQMGVQIPSWEGAILRGERGVPV